MTTITQYAKDQPAGFTNRIEKVAIVGVSQSCSHPYPQPYNYTAKY